MIKINYMSTLFVGIDVSSKSNVVYAMDFDENKYINASFGNNQPGADELAGKIAACMQKHPHINTIIVALESTSVYSIHIANFLASCELLFILTTIIIMILFPYFFFCIRKNPSQIISSIEYYHSLFPPDFT